MFNYLYPHYFYLGAADDFSFDIEAQTPLNHQMNQHFYEIDSDHQSIESGGNVDSVFPTSYKILRCLMSVPVVIASATIGCGLGVILSIPAMGYGVYESCMQQYILGHYHAEDDRDSQTITWRHRFIRPCAFCCVTPFYGAIYGISKGRECF